MAALVSRRSVLGGLGVGFTLAGCDTDSSRRNLAVFDAVWALIRDEHYAPPGPRDWDAVRQQHRPRAARAGDWVDLYFEVLMPMLEPFDQSHLFLRPPPDARLPAGRSLSLPSFRRGDRYPLLDQRAVTGLGTDVVWTGDCWSVLATHCDATGPGIDLIGNPVVIRGARGLPAGQTEGTYRLEVIADGQPVTLEWSPADAPPAVEAHDLGNAATLLRFDAFEKTQVDWLASRLTAVDGAPVVLDLRQNRGGDARELGRVASSVLPPRAVVGEVVHRGRQTKWHVEPGTLPSTSPLSVLIGPRTASSAEVLAAALRHAGRATLVGQRTAGAVLFSRNFSLPDGGALMVPIRDFRAPDGKRLEGTGVSPDREVTDACAAVDIARRLLVV